jgi:DNA repair protein RAD5
MLYREEAITEEELYKGKEYHDNSRLLNDVFQELELINGDIIYFNPFNGEILTEFPTRKNCKGGILADEMGLGKTVMAISLIHTHKRGLLQCGQKLKPQPINKSTLE